MANDLTKLAARIAALERRLTQQTRTSRLAYSSLENGALDVYDENGSLRAVIGQQPDGTTAVNIVNAPPPPTPSQPTAVPVLGGIAATWEGTFADAVAAPLDFARVEIHASALDGFTPSPTTLRGTVESPLGGTLTISADQPLYVRLLARNTSGSSSAPSPQSGPVGPAPVVAQSVLDGIVTETALAEGSVTAEKVVAKTLTAREIKALSLTGDEIATNTLTARHIAAGSLTASRLAIGTTGNLVGDPSYETGLVASYIVGKEEFAVEDGGKNSAKCLRVTAGAGTYRWLQHASSPVLPGDRYWVAADYRTSTDFTGGKIMLYLGFYDEAGTRFGSDGVTVSAPVTDGTWQRVSKIVTIPAGTSLGNVRVGVDATGDTTATGRVYFDNLECRSLLTTPGTGARAELSPQGLRLYDESGDEAVSLTTGSPNYLTLTNDGTAVATIDQDGNTGVADLAVAGRLTIAGDPIETYLSGFARGLVAIDHQTTSVSAGTTDYGYVELSFDADTSRMYRVVLDCYADPSAAGGELVLALKDGGASTPTISSTQIQSAIFPVPTAGYSRIHMETVRSGAAFGAGLHRLLITFRCQNGPSGQTVRLLGGSNHPGLMYIEDVGPYLPETGQYNTGGGTATLPKKTYTKTYAATWSGSYTNRGAYNSYYGNKCLQGYYSSTNGTQASLIGFPSALATDLSGATIQKAEVYLYFDHWYYNSGGKAVIKAHKHTSRPSTFSSDSEAQTITWGKNVGKWVDITAVFDSTSWRGIALDPNNSDKTYYGRAQGVGQTYPPKLRVTYTK
ncbi:hypothetical protein [Streptomyces sp. NEAU-NA10]|uniref:hypothetical protein n=1 Tax=Streptomyces sp. NEAU-NA10 TaxID=3416050 RepID=UPI003CC59B8E